MKALVTIIICTALFINASCSSPTIQGDLQSYASKTWNVMDPAVFSITPQDSVNPHHIFLEIRNTNEYPFSNIFLITNLKFPNGKTVVDTLEYKMARPDGTWLGTGIGSIKENKLWYKENFIFEETGEYILQITHAVRNNGDVQGVLNLPGISDVGYSMELSNYE